LCRLRRYVKSIGRAIRCELTSAATNDAGRSFSFDWQPRDCGNIVRVAATTRTIEYEGTRPSPCLRRGFSASLRRRRSQRRSSRLRWLLDWLAPSRCYHHSHLADKNRSGSDSLPTPVAVPGPSCRITACNPAEVASALLRCGVSTIASMACGRVVEWPSWRFNPATSPRMNSSERNQ